MFDRATFEAERFPPGVDQSVLDAAWNDPEQIAARLAAWNDPNMAHVRERHEAIIAARESAKAEALVDAQESAENVAPIDPAPLAQG